MDYLDNIETTELLRKKLSMKYRSDVFLKTVIDRNKNNRIRRTIWNLIYWYAFHHQGGVVSDMLYAAYRMGIVDERFDPEEEWQQA